MKRSMMRSKCLLIGSLFGLMMGFAQPADAQELNCRVTVNYQQLSGSEYSFLTELEEKVELYLNERSFTQDRYLDYERLNCLMQIIFEEALTQTSFAARIVLSTSRPIYGVPQESTILQINDQSWQFSFARGTPLIFDLERFDHLTSILDFYAYLMLGYDYDTFEEYGGTPHFERARRIAELGESQGAIGWSDLGGDRGRNDLVSQILDPRFRVLRKAYYDFHFNALDTFVNDTELAQQVVLDALKSLDDLYDSVSRQYVLDIFFSTKADEIAAIFEESPLSSEAFNLLSRVDPANLSKYEKLVN